GSGNSITNIESADITDNTLTASDLAATLTFADGDLLDLSAINTSSPSEGLILPQNSSCTAGTAEGQICWDTDGDFLSIGTGSGTYELRGSTNVIFDTAADSGTSDLVAGDTITINGDSAGIDTSLSGDTFTIALDTTEIGTTTFGSGSGF